MSGIDLASFALANLQKDAPAEIPEEEQPDFVASKEIWDAVEKKDFKAFHGSLKNLLAIALAERDE
jgi:hypothetical protein